LINVSMMVCEWGTSGTKGGVAVCASKAGAPASAPKDRNEIFMPGIS
jgi:hypothetical protein